MRVKCFECAAAMEAADTEAVEDAFVAHGRDAHTWKFPEQALRIYARNYAEASERLSTDTERLPEIDAISVQPVDVARVDDWLRFFDHDGFAGNPDWAACYCLEPHVPAPPDNPERAWRDARASMIERLRRGATFGYLAYVGGRTAGWVNASLRSEYGLFRLVDPAGPAPNKVIGIACFVIAPPFRRHRVASTLLDRVIADAPARGASWIEGYPRNKPQANDAAHFCGPRSMYEARGFRPIEVRERDTVMRRPVG